MKSNRECPHCKTLFENVEGRVFSNHVRWCKENPVNYRSKERLDKIKNATNEAFNNKLGKNKKFNVVCYKCKKEFTVIERENKFPIKDMYFCSRSCSNTRSHTGDTKEKIRKSVTGNNDKKSITVEIIKKNCLYCDKIFETKREKQKFCSISCGCKNKYKHLDKTSLQYYRRQCAFKFSIKSYPDEFDFGLLEEYGMYSPSNKNNNLGGVSRDHMVSVRYGYDNMIDPNILSHPANCKLVIHNDNVSKGIDCSITYDELLIRIKEWDKKYKLHKANAEIDYI